MTESTFRRAENTFPKAERISLTAEGIFPLAVCTNYGAKINSRDAESAIPDAHWFFRKTLSVCRPTRLSDRVTQGQSQMMGSIALPVTE